MIAALVLLQAGCASMTEGECLVGDWSRVGYQDGAAGHPVSRLSDHRQACAAYGVSPDADAWMAGRERGLAEVYCTPYRGFETGRTGREYHGVCPPGLARGFLVGYDDGMRVHAATEHRDDIRADVRRFDHQLDEIQEDLEKIRGRLDNEQLTEEAREALEDARHDLRRDLHRVRGKRESARRAESAASYHADRLRQALSQRYGAW